MNTERKYKFLGCNDDKDFCSCCGKGALKRVVWLENNETGEVDHFGTHCAALLLSPNSTPGKRLNLIEREALEILRKMVDSAAEKFWGVKPYRAFVAAIGKELTEAGVESKFEFVSGKTDAFCNFIWPYQKDVTRAKELGMSLEQYHKMT